MTAPAEKQAGPRGSDKFVAHIHELCTTKGTRADLRRGLAQPVERCNYLHRYLVPWLGTNLHRDARRAHYAIAALIAARPPAAREVPYEIDTETPWYRRNNLGSSMATAVRRGVMKSRTAENDLHLMSRQSSDSIHQRLPSLVRQLLRGGVEVDWAVLLEDMAWWNRDRERRATRWLESYFRTLHTEEPTGDTTEDTPEENER